MLNRYVRSAGVGSGGEQKPLNRINDIKTLKEGTFYPQRTGSILCFDLQKGIKEVILNG